MKLYSSPGACSLAPHIVLRETRIPFSLCRVDTSTHKTEDGTDYFTINPKGAVPLLELDSGERLSEGPVIAQYVAELAGHTALLPASSTLARFRVIEWQNYVTSELHKAFSPLFGRPAIDDSAKVAFRQALQQKYSWVSRQLRDKPYLTGDIFTIADAYLFVVTNWAPFVSVDLSACPELHAFMERVAARPAVQEAMRAEGLLN